MKNAHPFCRLMQTLPAVLLSATVLLSSHFAFAEEAKIAGISYRQMKEQYDYLGDYHRGLALVHNKNTGESSFVDKSGKTVFTFPNNIKPVLYVENKLSIDLFLDHELLLIAGGGLADKSGKTIIPPKFNDFKVISKGKTILAIEKTHNGCIFSCGNADTKPSYDGVLYDYQGNVLFEASGFGDPVEGMMKFDEYSRDKRTGYGQTKYGFINTAGEVVIPAKYYLAKDFSDGLAVVEEWSSASNKAFCGYIDKTGTVVIPIEYSSCTSFKNGVAEVRQGDDSFYINKQGKQVEKPKAKSNGSKGKKKKK